MINFSYKYLSNKFSTRSWFLGCNRFFTRCPSKGFLTDCLYLSLVMLQISLSLLYHLLTNCETIWYYVIRFRILNVVMIHECSEILRCYARSRNGSTDPVSRLSLTQTERAQIPARTAPEPWIKTRARPLALF